MIRTFAVAILGLAISAQAQSTQPTTTPADDAGAKAALQRYNKAVVDSDMPTILASIATASDMQKQALSLAGRLMAARNGLYEASLAKFGAKQLEADGATKEAFDQSVPTFPQFPLEQIQIKVTGDTAALMMPSGEAAPFTLKKVDGTWKIDSGFLPEMTQKQLDEQKTILEAAANAIDTTRDDVTAGHIRSGDEALVLMQHRMQKAVRDIQMKQFEAMMQEQIKSATQPGAATQPSGPIIPDDISKP